MVTLASYPNHHGLRYRAWLSAITVGLISIAFIVVPPLGWNQAYAPWVDTTWVYGPMFCGASKQWMTGHIPTFDWTTYETYQYNAHLSIFYPFYLFGFWDFCSLDAAIQGLDIISSLHLVFLFFNMLVLGVALHLKPIPAVFAATSVTVALNSHALAAWPPIIASAAWLPLALAGIVYIVARERYVVGFFMLVSATTLLLYAGPGSNMIFCLVYMGLILSGWSLAFNLWNRRRRATVFAVITLGAATVALLFLNLASTINLFQHLPELIRWTRTGPVIGTSTPGDVSEILFEQQGPSSFINLILPFEEQSVGRFYVGPLLVALAICGLRTLHRDCVRQAFAIMALLAVVLMYFDPTRAALILTHVPGMSHIRHLSLLATPLVIGMSLLAALALGRLIEPPSGASRIILTCIILGVALVVLTAIAARNSNPSLASIGGVVSLTSLGLVLVTGFFVPHRWAAIACLVFVPCQVAISLWSPSYLFPSARDADVRSKTWRDVEAAVRWIAASDPLPGRLVFDGGISGNELSYTSAGSIALYERLPSFQFAYSPRVYWRFEKESYKFPDYKFYGLRNGKYVVATNEIDNAALELVHRGGSAWVYRIRDSRPVVGPVCGAYQPTDKLVPAGASPGRLPSLEPDVAQPIAAAWAKPAMSCNPVADLVVDKKRSVVTWNVGSDHASAEVISLPPYRDWSLTVGGKEVSLFNLEDTQILAVLPVETFGRAVLTYRPTRFYFMAIINGVAVCILVLALICIVWRRGSSVGAFSD